MGGVGSGTWCRWDTKTTVEQCKSIDIRLMIRKGWLNPGRHGSLSWKLNDEPWGDIKYQCYEDRLILDYRYRSTGEDWQPVKQTIYFSTSNCNYGGQRKWLLCPNCDRRYAILYGADRLFLCRKCYGLPYDSQNKSKIERLFNKMF